ncbi:hypothetical protein ADU37_CDS16030 [Thermococcus sp. 2319x1]|nr:hypothetical protein ADU37_CDS16030 [Thermococcus sp. 2319x1]
MNLNFTILFKFFYGIDEVFNFCGFHATSSGIFEEFCIQGGRKSKEISTIEGIIK